MLYVGEYRQNGGYNASLKDTPLRSYYLKFTTSTNTYFGVTPENLMNAVQTYCHDRVRYWKPDSCELAQKAIH